MKGKRKIENEEQFRELFKTLAPHFKSETVPPAIQFTWDLHQDATNMEQNALQHVWYRQAAKQKEDEVAWEVGGMCKLDFAVPILLESNEDFRSVYKYCLEQYDRETQIEILGKSMCKCTRLLTKKEMTEYLSQIQDYFGKNGIHLIAQGEYEDLMMRNF